MTALFVTTAFAQTNVTLSGQVDVGLVNPIGADKLRVDQSANGANQIVFSGSEDLGGGLKATFRLAERFSPESGLNDGSAGNRPLFQGETTVGLAGNFGTVRIGRAVTALRGPIDNTDPWGTLQQASVAVALNGYSASADAPTSGTGSGAARADGIHYASPKFGGFTVALTVGPKSSQVSGATVVGDKYLGSGWLQYAIDPFVLAVGAEQNRSGDRLKVIQGSYNFGVVKVGATYAILDAISTTVDRKSYNLGLTAPMGPLALKLGYGHSKLENQPASTKKLGAGVDYSLSKRTLVYASYGRDSVLTSNKSGFDLGVRHAF